MGIYDADSTETFRLSSAEQIKRLKATADRRLTTLNRIRLDIVNEINNTEIREQSHYYGMLIDIMELIDKELADE